MFKIRVHNLSKLQGIKDDYVTGKAKPIIKPSFRTKLSLQRVVPSCWQVN